MQKKIKKVIIPAAGWGTRFLPLTKVVHKELIPVLNKPIIHFLVEEAVASGIEEIILVISPRKLEILKYFNVNSELEHQLKKSGKIEFLHKVKETNSLAKISIAIQNEQLGLGHAIFSAADLIDNEPFGVILGDDLIKSKVPALKQLMEVYYRTGNSVLGVQSIPKKDISKYGVMNPKNQLDALKNEFAIKGAVEKPKPEEAPSDKAILGRYIFTPELMPLLRTLKPGVGNEINVVDAFEPLMKMGQEIIAFTFKGTRYDLGSMEGFVKANIDYALEDELINETILNHIKTKY
ncbi:MAG: UTP--glucose-1-phosphate uridylyltransferase [Mycoplasmatales bacterium]|nr:UTP--glucose-1-phosphate uridylyltransferase [Mycoplasmatales bacterium]